MLWSPVYLKRRLSRPLPTKNGGILSTVKDVRTYVLALPDSRSERRYWQRACQLLLDQADVGAQPASRAGTVLATPSSTLGVGLSVTGI
jgi:hypothetical protein